MDIVIQQDQTGCGIACVAMLTDTSYEEVKATAASLGVVPADKKLWSDTMYVRTLLRNSSISCSDSEVPFTTWQALPDLALIAINYRLENGMPLWHWSVFKRETQGAVVYDPAPYLEENHRTDFAAMTPRWSIEIHGKRGGKA